MRYVLEPDSTKALFTELYTDARGKPPPKRLNLLTWFFDNYEFDGVDSWTYRSDTVH